MTAIALDDEPLALEIIQSFAAQISDLYLEKTFTKVSDAKKYLLRYPVDIIFLDINMPEMSGIEFYKNISQETKVIFTTAYSEFAVLGFEVQAVDYLLKPYSFERFEQAIQKGRESLKSKLKSDINSKTQLLIRADYQLLKIDLDSIQLIESLADYIKIKLAGNKFLTVRMTMKAMLKKLPDREFIRVHRSYIIPIRRIQSIRNKIIYLDDMEIQVGHSYETEVAKRFSI
jgi:DNA-binding LytR/AlgR family response regulator